MLDHTDLPQDKFNSYYISVNAPNIPPLLFQNNPTHISNQEITQTSDSSKTQTSDDQQKAGQLRDEALPTKSLLLATFTQPVQTYFNRIEEVEIDISLKKLHNKNNLEEATDATKPRLNT